ncbi:MAG: methylmalonyl-CoA carboxyltransferase [Acidimicrobiia bacterium]|nr:methylmalonyl-CoA carboxyltransferase [Acidimicrobiia bacterium]
MANLVAAAPPVASPATPLGAGRPGAADAALVELGGRTVAWFQIDSPSSADPDGTTEAAVVCRALALAGEMGVPAVGLIHSVGVDPRSIEGVAAWGKVAHHAVTLSGVVPILLAVTGPCHGGLAPLLGLADHVVFTAGSSAYINGPAAVEALTGVHLTTDALGGPSVHARATGLASLLATDANDALDALSEILGLLPDNWLAEPPMEPCTDPGDRPTDIAAALVPSDPRAAYDVRELLADVLDRDSLLEVHAQHATNMVTAYGRLGGRAVAIIANQPLYRAGTLDITASSKAARHVQAADSANLPILTVVDTPGFEPGKDLEWRGMIRHGAELVHAYAAATVPRVCLVVRKAYGGAYIVMDSKTMGSDLVLAWPQAEIAVMGAPGAVAILNKREIAEADDPAAERRRLEQRYEDQYCTPRIAAERGYVDAVIDPRDTRAHLVAGFRRLATKRSEMPARRHTNTPL